MGQSRIYGQCSEHAAIRIATHEACDKFDMTLEGGAESLSLFGDAPRPFRRRVAKSFAAKGGA